jgi:hypothetical protein
MSSRSVSVYLRADISDFNRKMLEAAAGAKAFTRELDTSTDRVANLTQSLLAVGPALIPISTIAVPAVAGLANELGIGAAAVGVAVIAFKGLGKALDAVNQYQLEPTTANFEKMQQTMATLGPAGRDFVLFLQDARPELQHLQDLAQAGLFPGLEEGLHSLSGLLPDVERIITTISTTLGELGSEAGGNLNSPQWHEFFDFLDREARPTLLDMGRAAGNFAEGLANLWMEFSPLSDNFSKSFLGLARDFSQWTDGLDKTQNFQEFVAYVNENGPKAWDTLGALANALLQIVEAAAPVGAATLPVIKAVADAISTLADSDLGPVIIGVVALTSAYSRLIALGRVANTGVLGSRLGIGDAVKGAADLPAATRAYSQFNTAVGRASTSVAGAAKVQDRLSTSLRGTAKLAGGAAGLAFIMSGLADKTHLANTATLGLAGAMFGPEGAAIGATIGLIKDLNAQHDSLTTSIDKVSQATANGNLSLAEQGAAVTQFRNDLTNIQSALKGTSVAGVTDEAADSLKKLQAQYDENVRAAQDAQFAEAGLAGQMVNASQATRDQTSAMLALRDAHNKTASAVLASANAELAYEQALDDAAAGAKKNKKGLDENTAAGRANLQLLYNLAGAWDSLTPAQQNAKGASDRARKGFIESAEQMGATKVEAEKLAAAYLHIPDKAATKILIQGEQDAKDAIAAVKKFLSQLPGSKTIHVDTVFRTIGSGPKQAGKAGGGEILGPGGPRDDLIPIMASNKEIMVNARDGQEHRDLILGINAGLYRGYKFAGGGEIGGPAPQRMAPAGYLAPTAFTPPTASLSESDINRLAAAIARQPVLVEAHVKMTDRDWASGVQRGTQSGERIV